MPQDAFQHAFDLALQHHKAGRLSEAERIYRQILAQQPEHVDSIYYLGVLAHQVGRNDVAVGLIRQAIVLKPDHAEAHVNLGIVLQKSGRVDDSIVCYRKAIVLQPGYAEAYCNLGNALREKKQLDEAIAAYRQAILFKSNYGEAYNNLGAALGDNGKLDEAVEALGQAIAIGPVMPMVYYNLGIVLGKSGQLDRAIAAYRQALAMNPRAAEVHNNLGNSFREKGQFSEAIASYQQAIGINPQHAEAYNNLANALQNTGQLDDAIAAARRAIALNPSFANAYNTLGNSLKDKGQLDDAIAAYRKAVALDPDFDRAHGNIIYALSFHPATDDQLILKEVHLWNSRHAEPLKSQIQPFDNDRSPDRKLKIGYVSPDFREHCQSFFTIPLLSQHDHEQFEIFCYADLRHPDAVTDRIRKFTDTWRITTGMNDQQIAEMIRQDRIDILVDLTMHMSGGRPQLFARKPAPIQVAWLAYPGTTGLSTMDYRLTDRYLDPPGETDASYTEKSIRLPNAFWCYDPLTTEPKPNALPALTSGYITFGCLNNFCKVTAPTLSLWAQVLQRLPDSRLVVLAFPGDHRQKMLDVLHRDGVDPARIEFVPFHPRQKYLELYHCIDMGLDTTPVNGHTTSLDSLWMGVPVVTLAGRTAIGRGGVSILTNVGLPELIGWTSEQHVNIAVELATDIPRLSRLRNSLRAKMEQSPLMDAPKFARGIETVYRQMWQTWCEIL